MRNDALEEIYGSSVILATVGYTSMYLHFTGSAKQDGVAVALAGYYGATPQIQNLYSFIQLCFLAAVVLFS